MMIKKILLILLGGLILFLTGCTGPGRTVDFLIPDEGTWYCAELEVTLVMDHENKVKQPSTAVINGKEVRCMCGIEYSTMDILLICDEKELSEYAQGDIIYWWAVIDYTGDKMILEDSNTRQLYSFTRKN